MLLLLNMKAKKQKIILCPVQLLVLMFQIMDDQVDRTLYVGGFGDEVNEELLFELFLQAGPLVNVVVKTPKATTRKFAFVIFKHAQSVPYAIELFRDTRLFGRNIQVRARMESKHANADVDTTDSTPIDLQHKVLEFITQNPHVIADMQLPDPDPPRHVRRSHGNAYDDEDSYDPMSNYSVGAHQVFNETRHSNRGSPVVTIDDDEYDPSEPAINPDINQYRRPSHSQSYEKYGSSNSRYSNSPSMLSNSSISSRLHSRLGQLNYGGYSNNSRVMSSDRMSKLDDDMLPYNKRQNSYESDSRQVKQMRRSYSLQNPYEQESRLGNSSPMYQQQQRSNSYQSNQSNNSYGRRNAYGR